ncbi:NAD(P)-dependent dehydrogenase (short-subunit alcohol dehydrogenase family) [Catenulispora sp. EB89]|uniref:SDR family NAD(P)-dependent oxidoreductase n=1 Tax=Catenulispora sp. EB89 TaxID=3156257 RepID=UPI003516CD09
MTQLIALVTGASQGIGKEIARQLAEAGLTVHVGSRTADRAQEAAADIGADARPLVVDVTDAASVAAAAKQVEVLDILVNNAGVSPSEGRPAQDENADAFRAVFETNVFGVVTVTNAFLPALRRSARPRIVNISSGTGSLALATGEMAKYQGAYASYRASKTALNALTVLYAQSLAGDGIAVNSLAPGLRRTGLNAASANGGDPSEAAAAAVRLALSPDDTVTGSFINWDKAALPW